MGFPTPNAMPDLTGCRVFSVPSDEEWFALLMGAVDKLTYEWAWYKNGTLTQAEAAAAWRDIIDKSISVALLGQCSDMVEAPYWDDTTGDDTAMEAPVDDQPWYGVLAGETFVEALSYWIVTSFLATAVSESAAIEFLTIPRAFRLWFKTTPAGAIAFAFMDGGIVGIVNLYSATDGLTSLQVISPGSTLRVVHSGTHDPSATPDDDGNYHVDVIRGRLADGEVVPTGTRYDTDCACVQRTTDGGSTWVDSPGDDPRHTVSYLMPPRTGTDLSCKSAASKVKWLKDFIDYEAALMVAGATVTGVANGLLGFADFLFPGGVLLALFLEIAEIIFDVGAAALTGAFTSDQYDLLLCIFFCNCAGDGTVSVAQIALIESQVTEQLNTTAGIIVDAILGAQGEVGLSNAGTLYDVTADCSGCECDHCFYLDLTATDGSGVGLVINQGVFTLGVGIVGTFSGGEADLTITWPFGVVIDVLSIDMTYTKTAGSGADNVNHLNALNPVTNYVTTLIVQEGTNSLGTAITKTLTVNDNLAGLGADINAGAGAGDVPAIILSYTIRYRGDIPSGWSDNC